MAFRKYLKSNQPKTILSGLTHSNIACALACFSSQCSKKLFISEHINLRNDLINRNSKFDALITNFLIKIIYPRVSNVIAVSKGVADSVITISRIKNDKVKIIYNPINEKEIHFLSNDSVKFPWKDHLPILISAGRLETQKDFPCLLRAFSILRKRYPAHLVILGEGSQRNHLQQLAKYFDIANDVWLPGFIKNPYPYLAKSSLFVLSSHYEGLGNVLVEALALGIPIVSTNCPSGPEEILANGKYGHLVPVGDPVAMAEAMDKSLSGDHPVFDQKEALSRFDPELITDQYLEVLGFGNLPRASTSPIKA